MQIHELTQPKKSKLDEVDFVGPDSVFAQAKSAIQTRGRSLYDPQAAKDAQQARYQADIANSLAQGKAAGLDKKPTLDSALTKLKANPAATQYVAGIVAKWPDIVAGMVDDPVTTAATPLAGTASAKPSLPTASLGGKPLDPKNPNDARVLAAMAKQGIKEAPEYTTPGGIVVPANSKTAQSPAPAQASAPKPNRGKIKAWINSQLKTTSLEALYQAENAGLEGLKGFGGQIGKYLDDMVQNHNNIPAQQKTLESLVSLVVAANHLVDFERRIGAGNNLRFQARQGQSTQPVQTGLTREQLTTLGAMADRAGGPDPQDTGNKFWNDLIKQALGSR
jgi:hypothetical protein